MPALYTCTVTQLEMQENMTSFTDKIVGVEGGCGSEIVPARPYFLAFAKHWQLPDYWFVPEQTGRYCCLEIPTPLWKRKMLEFFTELICHF